LGFFIVPIFWLLDLWRKGSFDFSGFMAFFGLGINALMDL
jgi:hypothetical protein